MNYLSNAFSLNMLPDLLGESVNEPVVSIQEWEEAPKLEALKSVVGHKDTAAILGVEYNRESVTLQDGDGLVVAQYSGPRMPEGATSLPEGAKFRWFYITVNL